MHQLQKPIPRPHYRPPDGSDIWNGAESHEWKVRARLSVIYDTVFQCFSFKANQFLKQMLSNPFLVFCFTNGCVEARCDEQERGA